MDDSLNSGTENKAPLFVSIAAIAVAILAIAFAWKARSELKAADGKITELSEKVAAAETSVAGLSSKFVARTDLDTLDGKIVASDAKFTDALKQVEVAINKHTDMLAALKGKAPTAPTPGNGTTSKPTAPTAGEGEYIIKAGDTFAKIAKANGLKISDIEAANPGVSSSKLKLGQKIKLPKK